MQVTSRLADCDSPMAGTRSGTRPPSTLPAPSRSRRLAWVKMSYEKLSPGWAATWSLPSVGIGAVGT